MDRLSDAQVLLLASQFTSVPDLPNLRSIAVNRGDVLDNSLLYRLLLTYFPLGTDSDTEQQLVAFLQDLQAGFSNFSNLDSTLNNADLNAFAPLEAERALLSLRLEKVPVFDADAGVDLLSDFVIAWIRKIEGFNGLPQSVLEFADNFIVEHPILRGWANAYLRPLYRLQNEFYPDQATSLSLQEIERAHGEPGVATLLQFAAHSGSSDNIDRDIQEVVTPWVRGAKRTKRRKLSTTTTLQPSQKETSWGDVNEWLVSTSQTHYDLAADAFGKWNGPATADQFSDPMEVEEAESEDNLAYVRTAFALVYVSGEYDDDARIAKKQGLLGRAARLAELMPPDFDVMFPEVPEQVQLQHASRSDLLENALLSPHNQLTRPSTDNIDFLNAVLATQILLSSFKIHSSTRSVVSTALFDSEQKQKQELHKILSQIPRLTRSNLTWQDIRNRLRWLQSWSNVDSVSSDSTSNAFLGRIPVEFLEVEILTAILAANDYQSLKDIYLSTEYSVLPKPVIQEHVTAAILSAYDNASNGNRTRGGIKKATDLIKAFRQSFDDVLEFNRIECLIKATHSLSFYQLILQHGVPFQPVNIRVSNDPLSLVEKVLDQNSKAYTKLDDLLGIARNLVQADLPVPVPQDFAPGELIPLDRRLFDAEHRITYSAIEAALADNDFDTAYSLITTRLATSAHQKSPTNFIDDTSWRAAYSAGKYRPSTSPANVHTRISSLQKRMDLLSMALNLVPSPDPLPEILSTWRRCEEELDSLRSQALREERAFDAASENALPGAFEVDDRELDANETRRLLDSRRTLNSTNLGPSYEEEAPMGLFDVARGAASAIRKNAFPLRSAQGRNIKVRDVAASGNRQSIDGSVRSSGEGERPGSADGQRVRKRDMLSNAVTGGLVSGMSWVLGAQPAGRQQEQD